MLELKLRLAVILGVIETARIRLPLASEAAPFIAMYWGSLMIGRWAGAINAFNLSQKTKTILQFIVPLVAFGIFIGINTLANMI